MEMMYESGSNKVNDLKFKLPSVTLANYGTAVPGKYGQIKKLQIVFTGRYEAYLLCLCLLCTWNVAHCHILFTSRVNI